MNLESHDLVRRLESLERENRRLKRAGLGLAGILGSLGLVSMVAPRLCDVVSAERFVLHDANGRARLTLDAYRNGDPLVTAHDKSGRTIAKVTLAGEPTLELFDAKGVSLGKLGVPQAKPAADTPAEPSVAMR
jgi:hypothetical protein